MKRKAASRSTRCLVYASPPIGDVTTYLHCVHKRTRADGRRIPEICHTARDPPYRTLRDLANGIREINGEPIFEPAPSGYRPLTQAERLAVNGYLEGLRR